MKEELLHADENSQKSIYLPMPKETPILFIDAIAEQNKNSKYTKQQSKDYRDFAKQLNTSEVVEVSGTHSIYLYKPDEIYDLSQAFIKSKVDKKRKAEVMKGYNILLIEDDLMIGDLLQKNFATGRLSSMLANRWERVTDPHTSDGFSHYGCDATR